MSVIYYLVSREHKIAYELGKSGGHFFRRLDLLGAGAPKTVEECIEAFRDGWLEGREMTANEYETKVADARTQPRPWFKPEAWAFVPEFERYITTRDAYRGECSFNDIIVGHREDVEYTTWWARDVWAFVQDPRIGGDWSKLEVVTDSGDLPWWDERGWWLIGSRYLRGEFGAVELR